MENKNPPASVATTVTETEPTAANDSCHPTFRCIAPDGRTIELHATYKLNIPDISDALLAAIGFLCLGFVVITAIPLWPTDLWSHLSYGQWAAEHGQLAASDPFSCSDPQPIHTQSWWGSQLGGYYCLKWFGADGLILVHAFFLVLTAWIVSLAAWKNGASGVWGSVGAALFYLLGGSILLVIRPQIVGMAAFAWTLYCAYWLRTSWKPILTLIPVFVIWANCHGSFVMGIGLLGIFALGDSIETLWQTRDRLFTPDASWRQARFWRTWTAIAVCTAAVCVNPSGTALLLDVIQFSKTQGLESATEWMPLSRLNAPGILISVVVSMVVLVPTLIATFRGRGPRRAHLTDCLALVIFLAFAWLKLRLAIWYAIIFPVFFLPLLEGAVSRKGNSTRESTTESTRESNLEIAADRTPESGDRTPESVEELTAEAAPPPSPQEVIPFKLCIACSFVFIAIMWSAAFWGVILGNRPLEKQIGDQLPLKIAEFAETQNLQGAFVASEEWSDYIVFRTHGRMKPLSYGYFHLMPPNRTQETATIFYGQPGWEKLVETLGIDYLVIQNRGLKKNSQIFYPMIQSGKWDVVLVDNPQNVTEALLKRKR